jgi:2,4-diketo-3-deoxy-L-fuconate hydrolase
MKICRFDDDRLGVVDGESVIDASAALEALPAVRWPFPPGDAVIANWARLRPALDEAAATGPRRPLSAVRLRSPVANPTKIIGIARNRKNLAQENLNFAVSDSSRKDDDPISMFMKANSALAGPGDGVQLRFTDKRNDPEAELTVIIGRTCTDIPRERALEYVFGYCIGLDMTLRGPDSFSSRKSIDSYAVLGPWVATADEIPDPDNVDTALYINGQPAQSANTRDLAFDVRSVVAHASTYYTLHPGDAIMMGTPAGFVAVHPGDMMEAEFSGIGRMRVAVTAHKTGETGHG